jgi:FkbM family methyltransferase
MVENAAFPVPGWRRRYGAARRLLRLPTSPLQGWRTRGFYRQFVHPGDMCFDIGAYRGNQTAHFLKLGARILAVEPQPRLMARLRRRFAGNSRVTLIGTALGATPGKAMLAVDPARPTLASLSPEFLDQAGAKRWRERIEVDVKTLDALIVAHGMPAFCKIDVGGYEHAVLEGLTRPLSRLSLAYLPAALDPALIAIARLNRLGPYRFNRSPGETMRLVIPRWLGAAEMAAELRRLPPDAESGDIYAFLDDSSHSR